MSLSDLQAIGKQLREHIEIKDRRFRLKTYHSVFLGSDAVSWLSSNLDLNEEESLRLGNRLIRQKIFHHVYDDHLLENAKLFYRFYDNKTKITSPSSTAFNGSLPVPRKNSVDFTYEGAKNGGKQLTLQQQLIQFRLQVQGQLAEREAAEMRLQESFNFQIRQFERSIRTLLRAVVVLCIIVLVLSLWQPLVPGWFGYLTVLLCVGYCLTVVEKCVRHVASQYVVSMQDLLFSETDDNIEFERKLDLHVNMNNVGSGRTSTRNENENDVSIENNRKNKNRVRKRHAMKRLPPISDWLERPVLLRMEQGNASTILKANDLKQVYTIDNEFFQGRIIILLKNISHHNQDNSRNHRPEDYYQDNANKNSSSNNNEKRIIEKYFHGHRRVTANYIQGRFKHTHGFGEILTGQVFERPLASLPSSFLIKTVFSFLRSIAPGLKADVLCEKPYLLTPLIAAAQTVHVACSLKEAPSLESLARRQVDDAEAENTSLLGSKYAEWNMTSSKRRKHFKSLNDMSTSKENGSYDPSMIYTFGFWQDLFDPADYCAHLPFGAFELSRYLDGQPMAVLAQVGLHGPTLWDIKLWHEKLNPALVEAERRGSVDLTGT